MRRPVSLLCLFLILGLWLAEELGFGLITGSPLPQALELWIEEHPDVTICGEVERCEETEYSQSVYLKKTNLIYHSKNIPIENVKLYLDEQVPAGTFLLVSGKLERIAQSRNPGEFDSRQYYACSHMYYQMKNGKILKKTAERRTLRGCLHVLRRNMREILDAAADEDAPLFAAMLLGDKSGMEEEIRMRYQMSGMMHLFAVSGLHLSVLAMGLFRILNYGGLSIRPAGFLALALMLPYGILTGNSVSVLRAMCMFLLTILAKMTGRIYDMLTALCLAAILLLLDSPAYLYSSGFLLSFGAVVGLGVTAPAVCRIWEVKNHMIKGLVSAASIQITMLPIQLWFFGEISVAGMFLNLLVVPTAAAVLCSGVGAVLLGSISIKAARAAALCGRFLFHIYAWLGELTARIPGNTWIAGQPRRWNIALYYSFLFGGLWLMKGVRKKDPGKRTAAACAVAGMVGLLFLGGLLGYHPRRELTVTCLDVGQGDAAVIQTPAGACYMIDCGSSGKKQVGKNQLLPFLKNQGIAYVDGIFVSHTDEDHISGIRSLLEYIRGNLTAIRVGSLILPEWETPPESWKELERLAKEAGAVVQYGGKGEQCRSGAVCMKILAPESSSLGTDVNEEGMVIELRYGNFSGLFTGDIGQKTEERLLESMGDADFLKVAHHGSRYSTGEAFLEQVRPEFAVISCSEHNRYGHPSPETVARLEHRGIQVNYTMKSGAVTLRTDGNRIRIETQLAS